MSLYNMLFGTEPTAKIALTMLGIDPNAVPRFRDAYFTWADEAESEPVIVIHTRTGGGNRDFYESEAKCRANYPEYFDKDEPPSGPWNADLRARLGFRDDVDCDHDSTYANFRFSVPDAERGGVVAFLRQAGAPLTPEVKFERAMDALRKGR